MYRYPKFFLHQATRLTKPSIGLALAKFAYVLQVMLLFLGGVFARPKVRAKNGFLDIGRARTLILLFPWTYNLLFLKELCNLTVMFAYLTFRIYSAISAIIESKLIIIILI